MWLTAIIIINFNAFDVLQPIFFLITFSLYLEFNTTNTTSKC